MLKIIIKDRLYGDVEIKDEVLIELLDSKPLLRLKNIAQYGVPDKYYHLKGFSRYEHSTGVMLLLKKLNSKLDEQIAGLLHDVSHTAFSHVIDWVIGSESSEDYQDKVHKKFLISSGILEILEKFEFDISEISNLENFKLLDQPIPNLCADRIDYALRDALWINKKIIKPIVNSLIVHDNKIIFKDKILAKEFGLGFLKCQRDHWAGKQAFIRYSILSDALKIALKCNIISEKDFLKDDSFIIDKLENSKNKEILSKLNLLLNLKFKDDDKNPDIQGRKKMRFVDPYYLKNNKLFSLIETDNEYRKIIKKYKEENKKLFKIKLSY